MSSQKHTSLRKLTFLLVWENLRKSTCFAQDSLRHTLCFVRKTDIVMSCGQNQQKQVIILIINTCGILLITLTLHWTSNSFSLFTPMRGEQEKQLVFFSRTKKAQQNSEQFFMQVFGWSLSVRVFMEIEKVLFNEVCDSSCLVDHLKKKNTTAGKWELNKTFSGLAWIREAKNKLKREEETTLGTIPFD